MLPLVALAATGASATPSASGWHVFPLAFPATVPFSEPPSLVPQTSNITLPACTDACTQASGCQGFAACATGPVGCWTYANISTGQLNHSVDCDWHAAPWAAPAATKPALLCNLHGNWSTNADYNAATNWSIHGNYTAHFEFFQPVGSRNFTLRADGWPSSSYGSVGPQAGQAFWLNVGDSRQRLHEVIASPLVPNAPPCTYIVRPTWYDGKQYPNGGWCKFPEGCPVPQPTNWAPWPPVKPAPYVPPEPIPAPPAPPLPLIPMAEQSCAVNFNKLCPLPKWTATWDLARSTAIQPCNFSGFYDPKFAAKWGLVSFDWSALPPVPPFPSPPDPPAPSPLLLSPLSPPAAPALSPPLQVERPARLDAWRSRLPGAAGGAVPPGQEAQPPDQVLCLSQHGACT